MNPASQSTLTPRQVVCFLRARWMLWLTPAVLVAAAVGVFAAMHHDTWEASQALIVRNEISPGEKGLGKFSYPEEMKTVQETILELLKSRSVLEAALREVGPSADCENPAAWPTDHDIVAVRKGLKLAAPKGAEFGKTEVFYLNVRDEDHARSIALNEAILKQLQIRSQSLRDVKAQSMIDELLKTVQVAKTDLDSATAALAATETRLGGDLAELRAMLDMASSDSALRRSSEEIRSQLRENTTTEKANEELLTVLQAAQDDPNSLVTTSSRVFEAQPSLRRLKEGLVDAKLRTADLLGTMSAEHPRVKAARETEEEIGRHLHDELGAAIRGAKLELRLNAERRTLLNEQLAKTTERLEGLAKVRAVYANEVAEVKNRSAILERAEQNLAEVRASQASAAASSLISRIDTPDAGIRPVGPTRAMIVLGGVFGGLLAGFGLVFLCRPVETAQPTTTTAPSRRVINQRWNDRRLSLKESLNKLANGRVG
jgi:polysaccharide biosynthesis transport protein